MVEFVTCARKPKYVLHFNLRTFAVDSSFCSCSCSQYFAWSMQTMRTLWAWALTFFLKQPLQSEIPAQNMKIVAKVVFHPVKCNRCSNDLYQRFTNFPASSARDPKRKSQSFNSHEILFLVFRKENQSKHFLFAWSYIFTVMDEIWSSEPLVLPMLPWQVCIVQCSDSFRFTMFKDSSAKMIRCNTLMTSILGKK